MTESDEGSSVLWEPPKFQREYEAALGDFLIRFNRIENLVSQIIKLALDHLYKLNETDNKKLIERCRKGSLNQHINDLELILLAIPTSQNFPIAEIRKLSEERNKLAHGHFEPDHNEPAYEIIGKGGPRKISISDIQEWGERADTIHTELISLKAYYVFYDVREPHLK